MAIYNFISQHKILKLVLSVFLCLCLIFTFAIVKPLVDVNASATALAILSAATLTISLFSWFGWAVDVGEELTTTEEYKELWSSVGYNADCLWHFICGDFTEWHYEKYGYLHDFSVWYGYYVDDNGNIMHPSYTSENPTDISVNIDWDKFEEEGTISFKADASVYNDIWFEIQEFMHGGGGAKYLSELVQEVSTEPTLTELRDSVQNLYLGSVGYFGSDISMYTPQTKSVYDFGNEKIKVTFDCFNPRSSEGNYIKLSVYNSERDSWYPCIQSYFSSFSDNGYSVFDLSNNNVLTEDICTGEWGVSVPYTFNDNTYLYLFSYLSDIVIKSSAIKYHTSYDSTSYDSSTFSDCIEKFDEDIKYYVYSSSSSTDDTVRNSATANKYAGTVDDSDGNSIPVTAPGKAGTTTVTGVGSLTNPVTGVKGEDYVNGTSVPITGTVEGATDITVSDTGEVAVDTTVSSSPQSPLSIEFITDFFGDFFDGITGLYSWLPDDFENLINGTLSTFFILSVAFVVLRLVGAIFEVIPFM